ncbi:unnamed protein product [Tilletia controversa]|nr:unnamed protein product [Tilletia controversa]
MSKTVEKAPRTKQDPKGKAKEKNPQDNAPGGSSRDDDAGPCDDLEGGGDSSGEEDDEEEDEPAEEDAANGFEEGGVSYGATEKERGQTEEGAGEQGNGDEQEPGQERVNNAPKEITSRSRREQPRKRRERRATRGMDIFLGRRKRYRTETLAYRPHNVAYVVLGTALLWFGWNGFNGGSAVGANLRGVQAIVVTNIAAAVGGLTWMFWDWRLEWSIVGFCSGVVVSPDSLLSPLPLKGLLGSDDALDIFAARGIDALINGGFIDKHSIQLGYQLADSAAGFGYSFVVTFILLFAIDRIAQCHFRSSENEEAVGIDLAQVGEEIQFLMVLDSFRRPSRK